MRMRLISLTLALSVVGLVLSFMIRQQTPSDDFKSVRSSISSGRPTALPALHKPRQASLHATFLEITPEDAENKRRSGEWTEATFADFWKWVARGDLLAGLKLLEKTRSSSHPAVRYFVEALTTEGAKTVLQHSTTVGHPHGLTLRFNLLPKLLIADPKASLELAVALKIQPHEIDGAFSQIEVRNGPQKPETWINQWKTPLLQSATGITVYSRRMANMLSNDKIQFSSIQDQLLEPWVNDAAAQTILSANLRKAGPETVDFLMANSGHATFIGPSFQIFKDFARDNPELAGQKVNSLRNDSPMKDFLMAAYASAIMDTNPDAAAAWMTKVVNPQAKSSFDAFKKIVDAGFPH